MADSKDLPIFKPEKYTWLKQQVPLDLLDIDEQIMKMPTLLQECGECAAQAIEIKDSAKEDLEIVKSRMAARLRGIDYKGKSRSETMIQTEIPLESEYQVALQELRDARLDASLWQNLMNTLEKKNFSIHTAGGYINSGLISVPYLLEKRRTAIREVKPKVREQVVS